MYHIRGLGTHYEIGFTFGARMKKQGITLLDNVPFELQDDRVHFAMDCIPSYAQHFPQILEEIRGISDGNECNYEQMLAVLLSMYCIMPEVHCSCIAVRNEHGVYVGRNSDFLISVETLCMNTMYHFSDKGYAFQGNTTAFVEMEDGINEHGLSIGLTSIYPKHIKQGLNAGMLLRYFLETCKSVDEVCERIMHLPIASSQAFTVADCHGNIACIECSCDKTIIQIPKEQNAFVCASNRFQFIEMQEEMGDVDDGWFSNERYDTMLSVLQDKHQCFQLQDMMDVLSGTYGFICKYDRKSGKDTIWSTVYDLKHNDIYRVEGNPGRKAFKQDRRFKMQGKNR